MENIKSISDIAMSLKEINEDIASLTRELEKVNEDVSANNQFTKDTIVEIQTIKAPLDEIIKTNKAYVDRADTALEKINNDLNNSMAKFQKDNIEFNNHISHSYKDMENDLLSHLQEIRNESKKSNLQFEDILNSKLDRNKSDIGVEIRKNKDETSVEMRKHKDDIEVEISKNNNNIVEELKKNNDDISDVNNKVKTTRAELVKLINNVQSQYDSKLEDQRKLLIVLIVIAIINLALHFL